MRPLSALLAAPLLLAAFAVAAPAQIGELLPEIELEDFGNTEAEELADYRGRAILIEFFAHW